jgi:ATP-dependent helicase/nuclease subunit A
MTVDGLLMRLYNETGLLALSGGEERSENLLLLYNYARKFESSSFEGLYNFISYVNTVISSGAEFSANKDTESENAVNILTVHKSKGLEYPVVFLGDGATPLISASERKTKVAYSDKYGIAMKTRIKGGVALIESPIFNTIIDYNIDKSIEEELRVYYVALTRAREQLYITGAPRTKSSEDYGEKIELQKLLISPYTLNQMKSFVDILCLILPKHNISWGESENSDEAEYEATKPESVLNFEESSEPEEKKTDRELYEALMKRFAYEYPNGHHTRLPEKMSISTLHPTVLDGNDNGTDAMTIDERELPKEPISTNGLTPEFISGVDERESAKRGIATHNFLQFFDIEHLCATNAHKELSRLVEKDFISAEDAKKVRIEEICLFERSTLLSDMKKAKKLYREFRFNIMLPAALFTKDKEKKEAFSENEILLQGVIDCIIEDEQGELHLVDYKTDRLTKDELCDKELARITLSKKHALQLSYYAKAVEKIFSRTPKTVRVYSLPLGDTVDVDTVI